MKRLIYRVFQEHLYRVDLESDVPLEKFTLDVAHEAFEALRRDGFSIPWKLEGEFIEELKAEVTDMIRKQTYGYSSIQAFVKAQKNSRET